jgi:plastocyanin
VNIANYAYQPSAATLKVGSKVTFVNHDATAHTATASGAPGFDTGSIKPNGRATVTLTKPGTYSYICKFHPFMKATITVG